MRGEGFCSAFRVGEGGDEASDGVVAAMAERGAATCGSMVAVAKEGEERVAGGDGFGWGVVSACGEAVGRWW